jgi:hypothetical protein
MMTNCAWETATWESVESAGFRSLDAGDQPPDASGAVVDIGMTPRPGRSSVPEGQ